MVLSQIEDRRISSESADEILLHEDGSPLSADSVEVTKQTRPLCVDLDGTLIKSDSLFDALCQLVRHQPLQMWRVPIWLMGGRAHLKAEIARRAPLDASFLPYNPALLHFLESQKHENRPMYLGSHFCQREPV